MSHGFQSYAVVDSGDKEYLVELKQAQLAKQDVIQQALRKGAIVNVCFLTSPESLAA